MPAASNFTAYHPTEGAQPTFRTEVKAVYDDRTLFVLVRAFDPHPDSIIGLLARRDNVSPPSDLIALFIDSYHDGRTGYEFVVNPVGVKADMLLFDDDRSDPSWDAVWNVATRVDSLGWVAEFAIPFSQLRFRRGQAGRAGSFGIMVWRNVGRLGERSSLPQYRPSLQGVVSQFGSLEGLFDLPTNVRLEIAPYMLARGRNVERGPGVGATTETRLSGGADVKFGPSPNVTLDATINPDFGQVESDPAVLNLTSFETFLPERRPFFLEGAGLFRFSLSRDPNNPESLFYTRRIGRRPTLLDAFGDADTPAETTILGAGKLTSRIDEHTSLASLAALTDAVRGAPSPDGGRYLVEPRTGYSVTRLQRDFRGGRSGAGLMFTGVRRDLDLIAGDYLPRQAVSGGFATQHQSSDGQWFSRAWVAATDVRGTTGAMSRVQLSSVHAYQRPDAGNPYDSTRRGLSGVAGQVYAGKVGGVTRYGMSYRYISPGFDPTDVGYISEANHRSWVVSAGLQSTEASSWYRNAGVNLFHLTWWSGVGMIDNFFSLSSTIELPSQWTVVADLSAGQLSGSVCAQRCTRGGPAIRKSPLTQVGLELIGDPRRAVTTDIQAFWQTDDEGRSRGLHLSPTLFWRAASNLHMSINATVDELTNDTQFYQRFGSQISDTTHYTIAHLAQSTRAVTTRIGYAATPTMSVEWYAQPFVAKGPFSDVRELNIPRAPEYDLRLKPYSDPAVRAAPGGVDFRQFRSNLVTRWEYRPGSVVFLVWSQGRDLFANAAGTLDLSRDARELFALPPRNIVAIKASYWFGR